MLIVNISEMMTQPPSPAPLPQSFLASLYHLMCFFISQIPTATGERADCGENSGTVLP